VPKDKKDKRPKPDKKPKRVKDSMPRLTKLKAELDRLGFRNVGITVIGDEVTLRFDAADADLMQEQLKKGR
jgi:hypothetical protein